MTKQRVGVKIGKVQARVRLHTLVDSFLDAIVKETAFHTWTEWLALLKTDIEEEIGCLGQADIDDWPHREAPD